MSTIMIIATFAAFFVKGMSGFANTLVFDSILAFSYDNINITPLELILGYPANIIITWNNRRKLDRKVWLPLVILVFIGSIPGIFFLKTGNVQTIKVFFGFIVIAIAVEMFLREYFPKKSESSKVFLTVIGITAGLMTGLFGIGALLAAYIERTTDNMNSFKGNLCMVFLCENTFRIILYSATGILTFTLFLSALKLIPVMLIGLYAGMKCSKQVSERFVKNLVLILLLLSGIALIIINLM